MPFFYVAYKPIKIGNKSATTNPTTHHMAILNRLTVPEIRTRIARADPDKDLWLNDGGGLWLHVRPAGGRAWRLRYTAAGKRRILDIGDGFVKSLAEARVDATRHRLLIDQGVDPLEYAKAVATEAHAQAERQRQEQAARMSLSDAVNRWKEQQLATRRDRGAEALRILQKDVLCTLGQKELGSVTKRELMECLDSIVSRGSRRIANICLRELHQCFKWCESRDWIVRDPLYGVNKSQVGGEESERTRVLSADEIKLLRDRLPQSGLERHTQLAIWILLSTLARVGELTQASWADVDFDKGVWHIPETVTKNGLAHDVFLSDFAKRHFEELRETTGSSTWLFPSVRKRRSTAAARTFDPHNAPMQSTSLGKQLYDRQLESPRKNRSKAIHSLVLPGGNWTPHDLRRTGATRMGELGVLPAVIEKCLNHKEASKIRRIYQLQELLPQRREAWQALGQYLDKLLSEKPRGALNKPAKRSRRRNPPSDQPCE